MIVQAGNREKKIYIPNQPNAQIYTQYGFKECPTKFL